MDGVIDVYIVSGVSPHGESFVVGVFRTQELAKEYVGWRMELGLDENYKFEIRKWQALNEVPIYPK